MRKIPVLIVTSRTEDIEELKELLRETPWELIDETETLRTPIVLVDRDVAAGNWQETMTSLIKTKHNSCVVLLSNVSDQYLWQEVVQHGGFDLLARPFRKEQVLSMLMFAYAHCRAPWPKFVSR